MSIRRIALTALALALGAGAGRADIVVSNLGDSQDRVFSMGPAAGTTDYAQEFSTGSQGYTLNDVQAPLNQQGTFTSGVAYLLGDNSGSPGTHVVATFTFPPASDIPTSNFATITFTPTSSVTLAANTDYWFALGDRDTDRDSTLEWGATNLTTTSGPGSLGGLAVSDDDETTWKTVGQGANPLIKVDGTPTVPSVPEPSSALLAGFGLLAGLGMWARHRRAARA